jgi:gliding motility-associated lipoprotein GldJ
MNNRFSVLVILLVSVVCFSSCNIFSFGGKHEKDPYTGWNYNDPDYGGFEVSSSREQDTPFNMIFIEGGVFTMGRVEQDVMFQWNNTPRRVTVESFYIDETTVSNRGYRMYLYWLRRVYVSYPEVYRRALPDTLVWLDQLSFNEPQFENYFRHPAYDTYPVVGVSWLKAADYCNWRTDRINEELLIRQGILEKDPNQRDRENFNTEAYLNAQYEGVVRQNLPSLNPDEDTRRVRMEDGILQPRVRLPTEAEWEYAALALIGNSVNERIYERRIFPWNGTVMRRSEKKERGLFRANFTRRTGDLMGVAGALNSGMSGPGDVYSFWPNDYGLYNMGGNVNEWVLDVYRPQSSEEVSDFNPFRGNQFMFLEVDAATGAPVEKDDLGRMRRVPITEDQATNQHRRIRGSDYRDYMDGDSLSAVSMSDIMYDPTLTLVTNTSRVYKGGSFRDRPYWLAPGSRRFLEESESKDDLGFRCAMSRVGAQATRNNLIPTGGPRR